MDRLDRLVSKIAEQHHGVFGAQHLRELGVKPHQRHYRLRIGRWISVHEGAYRVAGTPLTWRGQVLAACWAGGLRAVASHRSAAELWELPGRDGRAVELTCPRRRRARHDGLIVHESRVLDDGVDFTRLDGIPVTTAARTIFDLASFRSSSTVDLAIDSAIRRGLVSFDELQATLARLTRRGRAGVAVFRELLDERSPLAETESEGEHRLLRLFVRRGLPRPVTQHEIRDEDGRLVARVDFAYPDLKIAIEYDSYAHHVGKAALVRDGARRNAIVSLGWLPISATASDLRNGGHRLALDVRRARALRSDGGARE